MSAHRRHAEFVARDPRENDPVTSGSQRNDQKQRYILARIPASLECDVYHCTRHKHSVRAGFLRAVIDNWLSNAWKFTVNTRDAVVEFYGETTTMNSSAYPELGCRLWHGLRRSTVPPLALAA